DALLSGSDTEELDFMLQSNDEADDEAELSTDGADDAVDDLEALLAGSLNESDTTEEPAAATVDDADNSLHETVDTHDDLDFEIDSDLEAMLAGSADDDDDKPFGGSGGEAASDSAVDDLDSLLADFNPELDVEADAPSRALVEEELTSNISHDLEMDLDAEVDEMLSSTDNEIELSEEHNEEALEILDKMNLLSGADETETKLDLARAYLEMEDQEGARDILEEITSEGSAGQKEEARKLLESLD
ncbi:MAG: FimV/HubP family polar landmark protein, partial [Marinobacterium sp.]